MHLTKQRSESIDMVKGLSIMTLFFLHFVKGVIADDYNFFIVRSPAFYFVVGWLWGMSSNKRTVKEHWAKRLNGLVKPYLWFSLIFIIFDCLMVLIQQFDIFIVWRDIYKTLCLRGIGTLWFLPALLGGEILFLFIRDHSWRLKSILYLITFFTIVGYNYWNSNIFYTTPNIKEIIDAPLRVINDISTAYIYISIAYYISSKIGKNIFYQPKQIIRIHGILFLALSFITLNFLNSHTILIGEMTFILGNIFASYGIVMFFRSIEKFRLIEKPLSYCGKNSLIIMATHYGILLQIAILIDKNLLHHPEYTGTITLVYFLVATVIQLGIIELINKKFRFIIGK